MRRSGDAGRFAIDGRAAMGFVDRGFTNSNVRKLLRRVRIRLFDAIDQRAVIPMLSLLSGTPLSPQ